MEFWKYLKLLISILLINGVSIGQGAKILAIFPFPGPSQYLVVQPYLKTLAARGHEVTVISAFPQKKPLENYRDIEVPEVLKYVGDLFSYADLRMNKFKEILGFSWYYSSIVKDVMENENVQKLLKSPEEHFDLVIVETLQTDVLYGFAEHFKASLIGFSSYGTDPYIDALVDNISPLAYTPLFSGNSMERMDFWQRLENMWHNILMLLHRVLIHNPLHDSLYRQYFPNATKSLEELRQNISLILLNQHYSLSFPRPYVTNMIEVGGFHLQHKPQPLPKDIYDFLSNSTQDVIYFSMGSNIRSEHFPEPIRKVILQTFSQLPYKILWKFENPSLMANKPPNVFINKWFPQGDILQHPKVKLFISHGGLLSLTESIYCGKPILGMPIFFDQHRNIQRAKQYGFALAIDYATLNTTGFTTSIREIMENPKYLQRAQEISLRYRDQPMDPLEKAIYWTEFVIRHRGAPFLRSPAQYLNFWQKHSWDCAGFLLICGLLGVIVCVFGFVKFLSLIYFLKNILTNRKQKSE
ncbi:UDP-glucosyltransferase 2-like [Musca vetustissima]|uniref:UDP-glucosyltransferase 2-like n=1 Tax=Musca vetustissima TaxID=27455 RepID=UPI002AB60EA1|nr:UDP-glucosyltransferase 2-like [Musca vetustissima]